jgi:hypothetical protein
MVYAVLVKLRLYVVLCIIKILMNLHGFNLTNNLCIGFLGLCTMHLSSKLARRQANIHFMFNQNVKSKFALLQFGLNVIPYTLVILH